MLLRERYLRSALHVSTSCSKIWRINASTASITGVYRAPATAVSEPAMSSQRYHIGVKYIGTNLSGFTKSSDNSHPSVETLISRAMNSFLEGNSTSLLLDSTQGVESKTSRAASSVSDQWRNFQASSRTDAGVHAIRNSFHIDVLRTSDKPKFTAAAIANGLNNYLAKRVHAPTSTSMPVPMLLPVRDVVITDASLVDDTFDARISATSRVYVYRIQCPTVTAYQRFKSMTAGGAGSGGIGDSGDINEDGSAAMYHAKDHLISHPLLFEEHRLWYVLKPLNTESMQLAADTLRNGSSETDYSSFRNSGCNSSSPVRKILSFRVEERAILHSNSIFHDTCDRKERNIAERSGENSDADGDLHTINEIIITVEATSFLLRMVRNMVGLLVAVGKGSLNATHDVSGILVKRHRNANRTNSAPARGLYLKNVMYNGSNKRHVGAKGYVRQD